MKWKLECIVCGAKETFIDAKDIQFAKWQILAWSVERVEPIVTCPKCEYPTKNQNKK